ncbi:hypothetical protein MSAN_01418600 [Mycena sanguinolenta]|uniref:DUF6699 domain-containing protein n=1 Tax=Mycena sanguinolenta TaxID=230812 RepID=A0A8H7D0V1_9AGAR|nr:hypothetical protein MSAN_01418600 [Mycena sanguinolenta]
MPSRTGYVQPAGSPSWGYPYAGSPYASTSTCSYSPPYPQSSYSVSPGPMSPPPFDHSRSLYACAPLPALSCDLHPVLSGKQRTMVDVSRDPTVSASAVLSPRALAEPATTSRLPYFTITLDPLPWRIAVYPRSSKSGAYITVADVLHTIYRELHCRVTQEELDSFPPQYISSVRQAFHRRCSRLAAIDRAAADSEARKGIRRIDLLPGTIFTGLLSTSESPDSWKLTLS